MATAKCIKFEKRYKGSQEPGHVAQELTWKP